MNIENNDKQLLQRALSYQKTANDILSFLSDHFREKYHLQPGDEITPNGEIVSLASAHAEHDSLTHTPSRVAATDSLSGLQEKEKLNGAPIHTSDGTESNGTPSELSAMLNLSSDVALLHGTTEDN